jgi:hypothetical protein
MSGPRATPTRRHLLFAAAGLSGAALAAPRGSVPAHPRLDLSDPRVALEAYVKLRGSTVDATVWQPYGGDIFLAADGKLGVPLIGFWGLQKSHWRRAADGSWSNQDYDLGFYVDYRTRQVLERWRNPVTGREVKVYHYRGGPSGGRFAVGAESEGRDPYSNLEGRWTIAGGQVWYTASVWGERPNPLKPDEFPEAWSGDTLRNSMSSTYVGRLEDLADPAVTQVPGLQVWSNTSSWMHWMEMGRESGYNHWRWIGAKGTAVADLDPALVAAAERAWPGYVTRDAGWKVPTSGGLDYLRLRRGLAVTP